MAYEIRIPDELIASTMNGVVELFLKPKFISLGMSASGQWLNSVYGTSENGIGMIYGMDYTYFLVNGRKPGKAPPVSALLPWVNEKFGIGGSEALSVAFAVSKKIQKEGTEYYPEGTDLLSILNSPEVINYIYSQLQEGVKFEINKILIKQLHDNFS